MQMNTALSKLQDLSNIENVVELNSLISENSKLKESLHKHSVNALPNIKKIIYASTSIDLIHNLILLIYQSIKPGILNKQKIFGKFTESFLLISQSNFTKEINIFLVNLSEKCKIFGGFLHKMTFNKTYQDGFIYFGDEIKIVFQKDVFRVRYTSILEIEFYDQLIVILLANDRIELQTNFIYTDKLFGILANKVVFSNNCKNIKSKENLQHKVMQSTSETITISSPLNDICMLNNIKSRNKNSQAEQESLREEECDSVKNVPLSETNKQENYSKINKKVRNKKVKENHNKKIEQALENKKIEKIAENPENKKLLNKALENKKENKKIEKALENKKIEKIKENTEHKKIEKVKENPEHKKIEKVKEKENNLQDMEILVKKKIVKENNNKETVKMENTLVISDYEEISKENNTKLLNRKPKFSSNTEKMIDEISNYTTLNDAELISNSTFKSVKLLENIKFNSQNTSKDSYSPQNTNFELKKLADKILKNKLKVINEVRRIIIRNEKRKLKKILKEIKKFGK